MNYYFIVLEKSFNPYSWQPWNTPPKLLMRNKSNCLNRTDSHRSVSSHCYLLCIFYRRCNWCVIWMYIAVVTTLWLAAHEALKAVTPWHSSITAGLLPQVGNRRRRRKCAVSVDHSHSWETTFSEKQLSEPISRRHSPPRFLTANQRAGFVLAVNACWASW